MDPLEWARRRLEEDGENLAREMLRVFAQAPLSADADTVCGASFTNWSPDRVNRRNGYRERPWDERVGTIALAIPKLREGAPSRSGCSSPADGGTGPGQRRVRSLRERRVDPSVDYLVEAMGLSGISKSRVSEMAGELDALVEDFCGRPRDSASSTNRPPHDSAQRMRTGLTGLRGTMEARFRAGALCDRRAIEFRGLSPTPPRGLRRPSGAARPSPW
jgi:hypothetical protein